MLLEVGNKGDADATDVTVEFFVNGEPTYTAVNLSVPAHSTILIKYQTTAAEQDGHSARAYSDLYDTGEVVRILDTARGDTDDGRDTDALFYVGLIALVLALIALGIALVTAMRTRAEVSTTTAVDDGGDLEVEAVNDWEETPSKEN